MSHDTTSDECTCVQDLLSMGWCYNPSSDSLSDGQLLDWMSAKGLLEHVVLGANHD